MTTGTVHPVTMPQMGVSVSEGTLSRWMMAFGETVELDETLIEISTDKVDTEVPSPASGTVTAILAQEGDTLDVGVKIAEITEGGAAAGAATPPPAAPAPSEPVQTQLVPMTPPPASTNGNGAAPAATPAAAPAPTPAAPATPRGDAPAGRFVSPVVARIAAEHGIDVAGIAGTGAGGRVTKKDIMAVVGGAAPSAAPQAAAPAAATPAPAAPPAAAPTASTPAASFTGAETVVPFTAMRRAIARHMVESKHTSPHVTSTMEVDMTRVVQMRGQLKAEFEGQWGVKLTFTHFVIRALVDGIGHWPIVNAEIRDDAAVIKGFVNLGVAVALDGGAGLIVPVLRNAEEKNLLGIARGVNDLATRARSKQLSPDDVQGGTFTLTNPGIYGAIHGTPIINQPQVAILDTEAIIKRPMVLTDASGNDSIAIRSMMNLCMSYDHRLVDGAYAVQFLAHVKRNLETWDVSQFQG